ncbi:MAG: hypothetical protein JWN86_4781 [Planctomycetota bacterium]|nr:hypothetical protein [Planctomycetota bacterium]
MRALLRRTCVAIALLWLSGTSYATAPRRLVIKNSGAALGETPVVIGLEQPLGSGVYNLTSTKDGTIVRAEVYEDAGKRYFAAVFPSIAAGEQTFDLSGSIKIQGIPGVKLTDEAENVAIEIFEKPFTVHHTDLGPKPILYPLMGPTDVAITRDFPMKTVLGEDTDHPHQRSFWFTHGKVNGVDFWSELPGHGSIKQTAKLTVRTGFVVGTLRTVDDWLGPDGTKICEDERCLRVFATKGARVFDYDVTIKASTGPVTFGETKEGMFGLRLASSMDVKRKMGGKITNAEGLTDLAAWGKPSAWVDYVGPVGAETLGVAILNHPDSFRYPTGWHVRDYGLFAANPFGGKDFGLKESGSHTVPAGESIRFRYRVILHRGDTESARLPDAFGGYANGVLVEFK